jgi:hypothetical protein
VSELQGIGTSGRPDHRHQRGLAVVLAFERKGANIQLYAEYAARWARAA